MSDTKITEVGVPTAIAHRTMAAERVTLVIHEGDAPDPTTRVIELADGMSITLGRSRTCEVQIDSERVSRTHATFVRTGAAIEVFDAGSRNGTWLRGAPIVARQQLSSGDEVIVGSATVLVSITQRVVVPVRIESTRYLEERLAAEVDRGVHYHRRFGLALLQIGGPPELADAASDRLASSLRPMDGIAEYAPGLLAIVMPELDAGETARAATDLVALVAASGSSIGAGASIHVGIASFPEHSTTTGGLIARAAAALAAVAGGGTGAAVVGLPPAERAPALDEIIVGDPQMVRVYDLVKKVADHPITVLIRGETGVGKEVIAAALHAASSRRTASLVSINCASLPEALLESALFGHERGAFTGADRRKIGYFEAAHGGTLFLDEVGEMSPALQAKLLRVLENRRIIRVGGTEEIATDVRVLCATHRDLEAEAKSGGFRMDLYFRISGFTILVPPLRHRPNEIELLARAFIRQSARALRWPDPQLSPEALVALRRYEWPGNVRELRNAMERAMVLHTGAVIEVEDLPDSIREIVAPTMVALGGHHDIRDHIADLELSAIATALEISRGNQTEAAKHLGNSRRTLIYRMEKHGLKPLPPGRKVMET